jgi:uncharacterized protein DUF333
MGLIFVAMLVIGTQRAWALANPASVFCAQSGGKSEIRKGARAANTASAGFPMVGGGRVGLLRGDEGKARPLDRVPVGWNPWHSARPRESGDPSFSSGFPLSRE